MIRALARLFSVPDKLAMFGLMRGMMGQVQLSMASALLRSGVMPQLVRPRTLEELAEASGIRERDILRHLLDLGVRRRLLRVRGGRYAARSRLAKCVARDPSGPLASMLLEVTSYHHEVFAGLPERMRGVPTVDYLSRYGALVAQSSRIMAPWIRAFSGAVIGRDRARRILELGCGSGAYLACYAELHEGHSGVGIDMDAAVVQDAQRFVEDAGIGARFEVRQGDMRDGGSLPDGPFDVITAHQNVYYFEAEERAVLWQRCRERLADGGRLVIVTPTSGGPMSDYFALVLRSTSGCRALPSIEQLLRELQMAGFRELRRERLIPGDAVWGIDAG